MARNKKSVPLGSGRCYVAELTEGMSLMAADLVALCTDENLLGETKNGATLTYTASVHKEQDDHGVLIREITTKEEAKLKLGVFSWCLDTLNLLAATARKVKEGEYDVLKLGGLNNDNGTSYVVVFKHIDPKLGNLYVAIVGTNTAGLILAFARDNTTKLDPEFTALPCDDEGTLIKMFEALPAANAQNSGDQSGTGTDDQSGDGIDEQTA